jgi:hypothetical protein
MQGICSRASVTQVLMRVAKFSGSWNDRRYPRACTRPCKTPGLDSGVLQPVGSIVVHPKSVDGMKRSEFINRTVHQVNPQFIWQVSRPVLVRR